MYAGLSFEIIAIRVAAGRVIKRVHFGVLQLLVSRIVPNSASSAVARDLATVCH